MSACIFPTWLFVAVAAVIALAAFGLAQLAPGAGMVFAMGAALGWTSFVLARGRGSAKSDG